jgi:hypothetical protein
MRKLLALAAMPFMLAGVPAQAQGTFGIVEHACVLPIATFVSQVCSFSGGANIAADIGTSQGWIGPLDSGGFYTDIASAPGFVLSTQTGWSIDDDGGTCVPTTGVNCRQLDTFMVGVGSSPNDGKVSPTLTGNITVTGSTVGGSFTIGAGARVASAGGSLAGSKTVVEQWSSITHTLTPKVADSVVAGNSFGGNDYIIGSDGFPEFGILSTADGMFGMSEVSSTSGAPANTSPWALVNGGSGPQGTIFANTVDIVSYGTVVGPGANVGTSTSASAPAGYSCEDTGLDPTEPGDPVDTVGDCVDSSVAWGSNRVDPVDATARNNASFDNLVMKVSTDGGGNVVNVEAYYLIQYDIISPGYNSWVGGILSFTQVIPVPAAVWLFGSALGLLGWMRRRVNT